MLLTGRVIQGAFGALLAPATLSLLTTTFRDPVERTKAMGIYGGIAGAGASVGLLLGGVLTEYLDWRYVMYVNVLIAAIALVGAVTLLKHIAAPDRPKLDLVGTVLAGVGLFAIVYGFSNASMSSGSSGWTKPATLVTLIGGAVLLVAFAFAEQRVAHPLLPLRVIADRNRAGAYLAMFFAAIGMFGVFLFLTYYLEENLAWSAVKTGLAFLPLTLVLVVVAAIGNTVLLTRVSPRILVPFGLLIAAVGMALLTNIGLTSNYAVDVLPTLLLVGAGLGLVFAPAFTIGTLGVEPGDAGVASAMVNVAQQIGGSIGTSLLNTIAAVVASSYITSHAASIASAADKQLVQANALLGSYHTVFWVAAGIYAGAAVLCALVLRSGVAIQQDGSAEPMVHA
jgi:EmrB/QacA subfamily drug resistance transporter